MTTHQMPHRPARATARLALAALAAATLAAPGHAQTRKDAPPPASSAPAGNPAPPAAPQVTMPDGDKVMVLVRTALLTLNDAVLTGNFTVLRDKAAPSFQAANSAARLSQIFQGLIQSRVDLTGVATLAPQLAEAPAIDAQGHLRIRGYFQGQAARVNFDLVFEPVGGVWRLFGIAVNPAPVTAAAAPQAQPQSQPTSPSTPAGSATKSADKDAAAAKPAATAAKSSATKPAKTP